MQSQARFVYIVSLFTLAACSNSTSANRTEAQRGNDDPAETAGDPADPTDPGGEDPGDTGAIDTGVGDASDTGSSDTGSSDTGSSDAGAACLTAASGWRDMAPVPDLAKFAALGNYAWDGSELLMTDFTTDCTSSGCSYTTEGHAYDPVADSWRKLPTPPFGTHMQSATASVWTGTQWLLWNSPLPLSADTPVDGGFAFDPKTNVWTVIPPSPIAPRRGTVGVLAKSTGELVIFGGESHPDTSAPGTPLRDGAAYNPVTRTWRKIADAPIGGRNPAMVDANGKVIVAYPILSGSCECGSPLASAAAYDPKADTWTLLSAPPGTPRGLSSALAIGTAGSDAAFFAGEEHLDDGDTANLHDGTYFDGLAWHTIPAAPFSTAPSYRRSGMATFAAKGRLYAWSGFYMEVSSTGDEMPTSYPADGYGFDPTTGAWTAMPAGGPAVDGALAVWTGCDAIIFGGSNDTASFANKGKLFRP